MMLARVKVLPEEETLAAALAGRSLARYGDGELRICIGGTAVSQRERSKRLVAELREILLEPVAGLLVCIPNFGKGPRQVQWDKYRSGSYLNLFTRKMEYGSSFITRPDNAPWINTDEYWAQVRRLYAGKHVVLVAGALDKSLNVDILCSGGAVGVTLIEVPRTDAYAAIDDVERDVMAMPADRSVLLCAGAMATVLAWRLAKRGRHALDLGHVGMFMKRLGKVAA